MVCVRQMAPHVLEIQSSAVSVNIFNILNILKPHTFDYSTTLRYLVIPLIKMVVS